MVSQIVRRERENTLTAFQRELIINQFLRHRQQDYIVIDLDEAVLEWARDLLIRRSLKTLDALQLAGAFQMTVTLGIAPIFVCADKRLLNAAAAEGFPTDDPNYHP